MSEFFFKMRNQEDSAKKALVKYGIKTPEELQNMNTIELEWEINNSFHVIPVGENWILVPKEKYAEFQKITAWVK